MTSTIQPPEWATKLEGTEDGSPGFYQRDLAPHVVTGVCEFGDFCGDATSELRLEIFQAPGNAPSLQLYGTPGTGLTFRDGAAMREYAAALVEAAGEWDRVMGDAR